MKIKPSSRRIFLASGFALAATAFILKPTLSFAQGILTPPGAPAPTMKSLDQVEARTLISSAPFTIIAPGSYYLTGNLTVASGDAIVINADNVTLDLNGFTISSSKASPAGGTAISINSNHGNIAIANGHITGTATLVGTTFSGGGFANGILGGTGATRLCDLSVRAIAGNGIILPGVSSTATRCTLQVISGGGLAATNLTTCSAVQVGGTAMQGSTVSGCYGESLGGAAGVSGDVLLNCTGVSTGGSGQGINGKVVTNCYGTAAGGTGVLAADTATGCRGVATTGFGVSAQTATGCVGSATAGTAVQATVATGCTGTATTGTGLIATIGVACRGTNSGGVSQSITNKYNMP